jgi:large subunit ribosomal protein L6
MSRIGRQPIPVPSGVTITIEPELVTVKGPGGELSERVNRDITVEQKAAESGEPQIVVTRPTDRGEHRALHGLTRTLVANMVIGVTDGYSKTLEIVGTGYRVAAKGTDLEFALGFSHPVPVNAPDGISFRVETPTRFIVEGIDKQQVGEVAANIRKLRKPDPYKGKGVRYQGEQIRRKVGKAGK